MQALSLDEAEELRSDYKHLIGKLFQGKEVTDVIIGPYSERGLAELIKHRSNIKQTEIILRDADGYEVYLLLDYDDYSSRSKVVVLLRSVLHHINGDL